LNIFPWKKNADFFNEEEKQQIVNAIKAAEERTSGEIRLYIESHCKYMDAVDRAKEIFAEFQMFKTKERNATLIYVAMKDHQVAVFGDEGIHQKVGQEYWKKVLAKMVEEFKQNHLADGVCAAIQELGEALHTYFPYESSTDKNELPDEIIFGR